VIFSNFLEFLPPMQDESRDRKGALVGNGSICLGNIHKGYSIHMICTMMYTAIFLEKLQSSLLRTNAHNEHGFLRPGPFEGQHDEYSVG